MSQPISQQLVAGVERVDEGDCTLNRMRKPELMGYAAGLGVNIRRRGPDGKKNVYRSMEEVRRDCAERAAASQVTLDRYVGAPGQVLAVTSGSDFRIIAFAPVSDSASPRAPAQPEATRVRAIRSTTAARAEWKRLRAHQNAMARASGRGQHPKRKAREHGATTQVREWKQACQRRQRSAS